MHKISQMENVIPLFQYEPLVLTLESETSDEEEERGQIDGAGPSQKKTNQSRNQQTSQEEEIFIKRKLEI